jgi:hypothetical protein
LRQAAYGGVVGEPHGGPLQTVSPVDPDLTGAVDEHVGYALQPQQRLERPGTDHVAAQGVVHGEHGRVPHRAALLAECPGHQLRGQRRSLAGESLPDAVDHLRGQAGVAAHTRRGLPHETRPCG